MYVLAILVFKNEIMLIYSVMWSLWNCTKWHKEIKQIRDINSFNWQGKHTQQGEGYIAKQWASEVLRDGKLLRTNMCKPRQGGKSLKNLIQETKNWLLSKERQSDNTNLFNKKRLKELIIRNLDKYLLRCKTELS